MQTQDRNTATDSAGRAPQDPLANRLRIARAVLAWERLWPALWPALTILALFGIAALFDLLPLLPAWLHALALAGFVVGFAAALWRVWRHFAYPELTAARRRLERDSGMRHRPLFALRDDLIAGADDPVARSLWETHRRRVQAALKSVRLKWPSPGLPSRDPWALRALVVLVLVVGAVGAGSDIAPRFIRALVPGSATAALPPGTLDLWLTPPGYTGQPPILPKATPGQVGEIVIPAGSALLAQVTGGRGTPKLVIDKAETEFQAVEGGGNAQNGRAWRIGATLKDGERLTIAQGRTVLGEWTLKVVPDRVPEAEFASAPARSRRAALRLDYQASDDYGLASVTAQIRRQGEVPEGAPGAPIDLPLTLPSMRAREANGSSYHDLTAHPWAGLPVTIQLHATDAIGQAGISERFETVLPERVFQHPVARAIVEQRKALVADPSSRPLVARALTAIAGIPQHYFEDVVVYLGLVMASERLMRDDTPAGTDAVQQLLWDVALRIEDGKLSLAERELRALQQQLQDALANNAPDEEIERLIRELQEAINRYLQAMIENAQRNPQQMQPMDPNARRMEMRDLQKMLDQARQLARTGARDAARELLARLQDMLENLRAGNPMMGQQPGGSEAQQMMQGLQDLIQRQQNLLDKTFRRSQQGRPGQRGQGQRGQQRMPGQQGMQPGDGMEGMEGMEGDAAEQEALRRQLGEMMRQLGEMMGDIPGGFGRAERSMRDSGEALEGGQPGRALRPQMDALDQMRAGARDLAQQMMQQFGEGQGEGEGMTEDPQQAQNLDPAGRQRNNNGLGGLDGRDVDIPEASDVQRSREILDELLRRAGERFRPLLEREYIDRLLKRF